MRPAEEAAVRASGSIEGFRLGTRSQAMSRAFRLVAALRERDSAVLITGEIGTEKEAVARIIHAHSPRRAGPFVSPNLGALPAEILESELFGRSRDASGGGR